MKRIEIIFIALIVLCMGVTGCQSVMENNDENQTIKDCLISYDDEIIGQTAGEVTGDKNNYIKVDIVDIGAGVIDFSDGKGWYRDISSGQWNCIDSDGNNIFSLPVGYTPKSSFVQNLCLIKHDGYKDFLIDENGHQVFSELCTGDNDILMMSENNGTINIWVRTIKDTFEEHSEMLRVIDGNGITICEYNSLPEISISNIDKHEFENLGDGMYQYYGHVFNTNNNSHFKYVDSEGRDVAIINFDNGYGIDVDGKIINQEGEIYAAYNLQSSPGRYGNGLFFVGNYEEIYISQRSNFYDVCKGVFCDIDGHIKLDIRNYLLNFCPYFVDGYCQLGILNEAGITFNGIIDTNGDFLFEPVMNCSSLKISEGLVVINCNPIQLYDIEKKTMSTFPNTNLSRIEEFHDGWAVCQLESGYWGFIDKDGNYLKAKILQD